MDTSTISNINRSPNSLEDNNSRLIDFIRNICNKSSGKTMLVGDFNLNDIDWESGTAKNVFFFQIHSSKYLGDSFLIQIVVSPTRATRGLDEPHLLDLVITNDSFIEHIKYMSPLGKE